MEPAIGDIDLQDQLSAGILTDPLESNPVRYEPGTRISDDYLMNQWPKKENSPLVNQTYYIQTTSPNGGFELSRKNDGKNDKPRQPAKKRKPSRGNEGYKFSCDRCALTFNDPKEAIAHIHERHMATKNIIQADHESKFQYEEIADQQANSNDAVEVTQRTGQGPLLLLVDDNQIMENDERGFNIQYAEVPNIENSISQEIRQKAEMVHNARQQKKMTKRVRKPSARFEMNVGDAGKLKRPTMNKKIIRTEIISGRKPARKQQMPKIQIIEQSDHQMQPLDQEIHQLDNNHQVVHINQLENSIESVIGDRLMDDEDDDSDLQSLTRATAHQTGQNSVVVSTDSMDMDQDMVQFSNPIEDPDHDAIEHELFKDEKRLGKYLCDLCPSVFTSKVGLNDHVKSFHLNEKRFSCDKCGKMFFRKNKLLQHMDGHAEEKMHICHVCGKRFQFKTSLVHHLNCHSENPRFKCQFCGKILSAHKMLLKHLVKQHNQQVDADLVPMHTCEMCTYKTIYKSDLTKHKRKHTGEKPYRCPICHKEFSDSSILRRHEVVHTGEKPWKCYLCDKAYTLRSTLTNHFKKAHSTWPNPIPACPTCKREFENREDIFTHMKEVHGTDPASLNAHIQSMKEGCIVGGKQGTNQEIVMPSKPAIINTSDFKMAGNQFQIVMNGEPLQIIPVDQGRTEEITIDHEGRHIITDGQPLEVILQGDQVFEENRGRVLKMDHDIKLWTEQDVRKMGWTISKAEPHQEIKFRETGENYSRIVMMNDESDMRKYNVQLVSSAQSIGQQQIIYTETSETSIQATKPNMTSVVMTTSPSTLANNQVSLIQTVSVPTSQSPEN